jgi:arsenate reductase
MNELEKIKVLFLCTANSCRSQMAEGLARHFGGDLMEVYSAGLTSLYIQPRAIEVMKEIGIDISTQKSEAFTQDLLIRMDIIITLCGHAEKTCPATPTHMKRFHWPIKDPVGAIGSEVEIMNDFRRARDEIREKVEELITYIRSGKG